VVLIVQLMYTLVLQIVVLMEHAILTMVYAAAGQGMLVLIVVLQHFLVLIIVAMQVHVILQLEFVHAIIIIQEVIVLF